MPSDWPPLVPSLMQPDYPKTSRLIFSTVPHPCHESFFVDPPNRLTLSFLSTVFCAQAQVAFPTRPVSLVTAFAAGSGPDAVLRKVGEKLSKLWNQPVTITNRPGGGSFIAIDSTRRSAPDGYTLLQLDSEHLAALPLLYKTKAFVTLDNFDPVVTLFRTPFLVAVASDSKWKNMQDLVSAAKAAPGAVSYGSWGVGSPGHLGGEEIELLT